MTNHIECCVKDFHLIIECFSVRRFSVRLGEWDLDEEIDCQDEICSDSVLNVPIKFAIPHELYQPNSHEHAYDIALILLDESIPTTNWIRPICLPIEEHVQNANLDSIPMKVSGWGFTSSLPNGITSTVIILN